MKKSKNNIDTGRLIENFMTINRISKAQLGRDIDRSGSTVLSYTENNSIQTGILLDICHAFKHNFFKDIADSLPEDFTYTKPKNNEFVTEKDQLIAQLQEELRTMSIENNLMKKALKIG